MVEILWNSDSPHTSIRDHEFYELRMVDLGNASAPRFLVREIHGSWSASAQQIQWNGYKDETCWTRAEARRRFETRKAFLADSGFPYSSLVA